MSDTPQTLRAALWMIGAIASFTAMAVAGRAVSFELDTFEIMMYRSFIGMIIVTSVAGITGHLGDITRRHMSAHTIRNIAHFAGQNLWFFALTVIPLAHTTRASVSKVRSASCQVGMLLASYPQTLPCAIWAKTFMVFR